MADITSRYCKNCRAQVSATRPSTNHILHFLITMFTCGFWVFVWIGLAIKCGGFRCTRCGSKV